MCVASFPGFPTISIASFLLQGDEANIKVKVLSQTVIIINHRIIFAGVPETTVKVNPKTVLECHP